MHNLFKKIILGALVSIVFFVPVFAFAETTTTYTSKFGTETKTFTNLEECASFQELYKSGTCNPVVSTFSTGGWGLNDGSAVDTSISSLYTTKAACESAYQGKTCSPFASKGAYLAVASDTANSQGTNLPAENPTSQTNPYANPADGDTGGFAYQGLIGGISKLFKNEEECLKDRSLPNFSSCTKYESNDDYVASGGSQTDPNLADIPCELIPSPTFGACVAQGIYYIFYRPAEAFLGLAANVFDYSLFLSINQQYVNQPFVTSAWEIMRDFSNMVFIFVLLYTGIMTMFGLADTRRTIINVVIIALLINFSLFFTKIVIDAGNILAVGIYESMAASPATGKPREISIAITNSFSPGAFQNLEVQNVQSAEDRPLNRMIIFLVAAVVSAVAGWIFITVAFLFIGRLLAFWFLMIVSPIAFISMTLPKHQQLMPWFSQLLKQSMVAPVFLFLLYLIMQFVSAGGGILSSMDSLTSGGSMIYSLLLAPILKAALVIFALFYARDITKSLAGKFGEFGTNVVGKGLGIAAGVALGGAGLAAGGALRGAAYAGRWSGGRIFKNVVDTDWAKKQARKTGIAGAFTRPLYSVGEKLAEGSYDARNAPGVGWVSKQVTKGLGKVGVTPLRGLGEGVKTSYGKDVATAKKRYEEESKKLTTDKDGKLIPGAAKEMAEQLNRGYFFEWAAGNQGAREAAKSILKSTKKRADLEEEQNTAIQEYTDSIKFRTGDTRKLEDIPAWEKEALEGARLTKLQKEVIKAEVELEMTPKPADASDIAGIEAQRTAKLAELKAKQNLKKFENAQTEIEKIQKALEKLKAESKPATTP